MDFGAEIKGFAMGRRVFSIIHVGPAWSLVHSKTKTAGCFTSDKEKVCWWRWRWRWWWRWW